MIRYAAVPIAVACLLLVGCSSSKKTTAVVAPPTTPSTSVFVAPTTPDLPSIAPVPTTSSSSPSLYPKGYPKIVSVSSLPDQVKNWYQLGHYTKAVAVAPGVWTPLSVGASMEDALASEVLDGFCGSIKAYERKYLAGQEQGGTCW